MFKENGKRISKETIDKILDHSDILEVVQDYVKLQKAGKDWKGLSPFTSEKSPSFYVCPTKGIFKCFSSGKGGNVVTFLMEHEKLTYPQALRWLADKYKIEIAEDQPEDPEVESKRDLIFQCNLVASRFYASQLYLPENSLALEYLLSRFSKDDIIAWQIGIAPDQWTSFHDHAGEQGYDNVQLITSNLCREKNDRVYDYFRNRIIFPIMTDTGNVAGFGGRALPWDKEDAKYINSSDSEVYNKSRLLYGFLQGRKAIAKSGICNVVEGYGDVISMHKAGLENTVGPCGTALTEEQALAIKKLCKKVNLVFDGDTAGFDATLRTAEIFLHADLYVMVTMLPEGEDPGSYIKAENKAFISDNSKSFISWRAMELLKNTDEDPMVKHIALKEVVRLLSLISEKSLREIFIDDLVKKNKLQKKVINDQLQAMIGDRSRSGDDDLPADVDAREFERWGFYEYENEYYFRTKENIMKVSNFIMKPLFHVKSSLDTRRIYELINYKEYRNIANFDMQEMTSLQAFRKNVEGRGNFLFWGMDAHFNKLKMKLYEETRSCLEIKNLGWQKEGFWAWSNGIYTQDGFTKVDEYGLVEFDHQNYFIAAYSNIYLTDKSIYIEERKFKFKSRDDISLRQWSEQFILVFGKNAQLGICFWIASIFRDFILHIFRNFPMLNLFGPKGTGKSQMAMSLSYLFGQGQTPFNIHNGTKPGLAEHIQQFINSIAVVEEYKNSLEYDKIETLKSIYDAVGRSRINMDKGKKKETTQVNSAVIITGQEMPTADVALFSRMIFLSFHKTIFSDEEKYFYKQLKDMEGEGLSHLSSQLIKYRDYFEKHFYKIYDNTLADLSGMLSKDRIEDRILNNFCTIIAAFRTLEDKLDLPFTYIELKDIACDCIRIQNQQVGNSGEVSKFWNILEAMFDENILIDQWHFKIQWTDSINATTRKIDFGKGGAKFVLKFKCNSIITLYAEKMRKSGEKPLPTDTMKYYLDHHDAFIGIDKAVWFYGTEHRDGELKSIKTKTTAYCFDYEKLKINLTREPLMAKENELAYIDEIVESKKDNLPW